MRVPRRRSHSPRSTRLTRGMRISQAMPLLLLGGAMACAHPPTIRTGLAFVVQPIPEVVGELADLRAGAAWRLIVVTARSFGQGDRSGSCTHAAIHGPALVSGVVSGIFARVAGSRFERPVASVTSALGQTVSAAVRPRPLRNFWRRAPRTRVTSPHPGDTMLHFIIKTVIAAAKASSTTAPVRASSMTTGAHWKAVLCEHCGAEWAHKIDAFHGSDEAADRHLGRTRVIACPACGKYQAAMVERIRAMQFAPAARWGTALLTLGVAIASLAAFTWLMDRTEASALAAAAPLLVGGGVGLLLWRRRRARRFDPNQGATPSPDAVSAGIVVTREEHEELLRAEKVEGRRGDRLPDIRWHRQGRRSIIHRRS